MSQGSAHPDALRVGIVGLGTMGAPMARNVLAAGLDVSVLHHSRERVADLLDAGAHWRPTGRELAEHSDVLISMLPDLPDLETVLSGPDGIVAGAGNGLVLVICSTSSAEGIRALATRLDAESGGRIRVIDSPVSGGEEGAKAGTLSLFVGGDPDAVAAARPALAPTGVVHHLGPLGSGAVAKFCNQMIVAATVHSLGEASVIADRSGLDLAAFFEALGGGYAWSRVLETRGPRMVADDYHPSGAAKYMIKDLGFAEEEALHTGVDARQLAFLSSAFRDLRDRGYGDNDISVTRAYVRDLSSDSKDHAR
ncbi:NAD(P)-dependent oxidoreductase [Pseudolysinimonas sp.]|uniref:NAD(P)-dependent oxidoreductase n=1 Tax=Pseudolysinimonas sp. TaxID=2680009 RepID=UPI00286C13BA|nr:NAD(P)-dependent oxidoreductase [Pseudolysinimonas sp.]